MKYDWLDWFTEQAATTGTADGRRRSLARVLLVLTVGSLCLAALVAITVLLFGDFGETEGKILLTVLALAGYSLLGLGAATAAGRKPSLLAPSGLGISAGGFVLFVVQTWAEPDGELIVRLTSTFLALAVAIAHAALLLLLTRHAGGTAAEQVRRATLAASSVLTVMIIVPLLTTWEPSETYLRLMGAMAVLTVLGSLLVPIVWTLAGRDAGQNEREPGARRVGGDGRTLLDLRYMGRTFAVQVDERDAPPRGFAVAAWEITAVGREPVLGLEEQGVINGRHAALAFAVQRIAEAVDRGSRPGSSAASEQTLVTVGGARQ